ncbi:MAG: VanW family protein [Parcubacteria group bacterium]|jgi:vancomycin resistance protein YoaR
MKSSYYFTIFLFAFFLFSPSCSAEMIDLGFFNTHEILSNQKTDLSVKIRNEKAIIPATEVAGWFRENPSLDYSAGYGSEIENGNLCAYSKSLLCKLVFSYRQEAHFKKKILISLDTELMKKSITNLSDTVNSDPINPGLKIEDGKVTLFSLSSKGLKLDEDKSLIMLIDSLKNNSTASELNLPYTEIDPTVTQDSIENMGINTLLGEGHSNFKGSPKNRIFNINVATDRFNGVLIKPKEEFSFVSVLGEVDGEHGYLPELVIKQDKTEPEFGGGICQVSTTAFRAAIYSGLEITARRNHAYPVSYYNPQGMDSTVYVPKPDLRFINDTPGYILLQTKIEGTELTFQFYGTSDGRKTTVLGPTILERNPDGSMKTTFTQQVYDKDNNLVREDEFKSNYESPSKFPHPGETTGLLTKKPKKWSDREWRVYKKEHGMN